MTSDVRLQLGGYELVLPGTIVDQSVTVRQLLEDVSDPANTVIPIPHDFSFDDVNTINEVNHQYEAAGKIDISTYSTETIINLSWFYDYIGFVCGDVMVAEQRLRLGDLSNFPHLFDLLHLGKRKEDITNCSWKKPSNYKLKTVVLNTIFRFSDYKNTITDLVRQGNMNIDHLRDRRCNIFECITREYFSSHPRDIDRAYFAQIIRCNDIRTCNWVDELLLTTMDSPNFEQELLQRHPFFVNFNWTNVCMTNAFDNSIRQLQLSLYGLPTPQDREPVIRRILQHLAQYGYSQYEIRGNVIKIDSIDGSVLLKISNDMSIYHILDKVTYVKKQTAFDGVQVLTTYPCKLAIEENIKDYRIYPSTIGFKTPTPDTLWEQGYFQYNERSFIISEPARAMPDDEDKQYGDIVYKTTDINEAFSYVNGEVVQEGYNRLENDNYPLNESITTIYWTPREDYNVEISTGVIISHNRIVFKILAPSGEIVEFMPNNILSSNFNFLRVDGWNYERNMREHSYPYGDLQTLVLPGDIVEYYGGIGTTKILINRSIFDIEPKE